MKDAQREDPARQLFPSSPMEQTDQSGGHSVKSVNQPEQPVSSGVKRDARAAELPDEDEQGGMFQQLDDVRILGGR